MPESTAEGEGRSGMGFTNIETASDFLDNSVIFHVITDILGFVLYMHQQIPSPLQDVSLEFDESVNELKDLETVVLQSEMTASSRRKHIARKRELKHGIRRIEKLMTTVANLKTAIQHLISEMPNVGRLVLVLGPSPLRPLHVYELFFAHGRIVPANFSRRVAEGLSRKAIRTLISRGAGSDRNSYAGPSKLFLLVEAPATLELHSHFLPKRDFRYSKKIIPFKLQFKCRTQQLEIDARKDDPQTSNCMLIDSMARNSIWFQCRHVIKGLASAASSTED